MAVILKKPAAEADRIRATVWDTITGAPDVVPVDPVRIAHELGIDVLIAQLDPRVSGAIVKRFGHDPQIILNREDSRNRQRFSCAHELGHYVLKQDDPNVYEYVDYRDDRASTGTDDEERWANGFAANLLMPTDLIRRRAMSGHSAIDLAYEFRVSQEAMVNRFTNLGLPVA